VGINAQTADLPSVGDIDLAVRPKSSGTDGDVDITLVSRNGLKTTGFVHDQESGTLFISTNPNAGAPRLSINGATLSNGGTWTNQSSRALKEGFSAVNSMDILRKVAALPITTWTYKRSGEGLHMGPVAEDFKAAFGLAGDGTSIGTVDADGVALAAIQGLNQKLELENAAMRKGLSELRAMVQALATQNAAD
jgi:trimeric autotransporter adhesin